MSTITLTLGPPPPPPTTSVPISPQADSADEGKTKLYIGIGVGVFLIVVGILLWVFVFSGKSDDDTSKESPKPSSSPSPSPSSSSSPTPSSFWVAVGNSPNTIIHSNDGTTWTGLGKNIFSGYGKNICFGNVNNKPGWIAVGSGTNSIAYSHDGIVWTGLGLTIFDEGTAVAYNGSMWVATGFNKNTVATSSDGITWTGLASTIFSEAGHSVHWSPSGEIWLIGGSNSGNPSLAYSKNGTTWTKVENSHELMSTVYGITSAVINKMTVYVAVGHGKNTIMHSTDGNTWTGYGRKIFNNGMAVIYNTDLKQFVAVGGPNPAETTQGTIAFSDDGQTWTSPGNILLTKINAIAFKPEGKMIACGNPSSTNSNVCFSYAYPNPTKTWEPVMSKTLSDSINGVSSN